jgi:imidazolonepropionase-like amidohydrolase
MQAIAASTSASAEILGVRDFGTLEPGKQADLMVLDSDPLEDIRNTEKLSAVWQGGKASKAIRPL